MSQNFERFGVEAVWSDAKFEKGVKDYNNSMKEADKNTQKFTSNATRSFQKFDKQASTSFTDATAKVLAWGFATQQVFAQFEQGAREAAARDVFVRLSGGAENATANINALREATGSAASNQALMEQATTLLNLKIAKSSDELGRAARSITTTAAAAKGFTADQAIQSFTLLASNFESSKARLDDFGLSLDDVQPKIDAYKAAGEEASDAIRLGLLDALDEKFEQLGGSVDSTAKDIAQFRASGDNLLATLRAAVLNVADVTGVLDFLTQGLEAGAKAAALAAGGLAALFNLISSTGLDDIGDLISGQITLSDILDESAQVGIEAFTSTAEALGVFTNDLGAATEATEELGTATEETTGDLDKFNQTLANARTQALEAFLQRAIATERQLEDAAIQRARKIEDIERQAAARRAQIQEQYTQTVENIQAQAAEQRRQRETNLARQLEQIERQYQERKRAIQAQFSVSFQRAVRSRDALALVEAIRTRAKDLDEAKRQRDQQRADATTDAAQQEQEQQRSLQRQLEAARLAREQQIAEAQEAQQKQIEDLQRSDQRKQEDQQRANTRWLQDQQQAFQNRQVQASAAYRQDESIYTDHLQRMLQLTNTYIPRIFTSRVAGGGFRPGSAGGGGGAQMLAEGGAFIAQGATPFVAGEAGPELVIAQPLSQIGPISAPSPQVSGQMRHAVTGEIQASMAGFQGRLTAAVNEAVLRAFQDVLR